MPDAPAYTAVLFDMDGVILDSMAHHAETWQEAFTAHGYQVSRRFILENEGCLGPEVLGELMAEQPQGRRFASGGELMESLLACQIGAYLEHHAPRVRPFPQAEPLLSALRRRGTRLALVTSSRHQLVRACLGDLYDLFHAVVTSDDVSHFKPHPEPYQAAARALGMEPGDCLAVENAPAGIRSASAAGACCYALTTTLEPSLLSEAQAVFNDLGELQCFLKV